ncbi:MAG: dihydrodipicolinate synthase family protein [Oscillospiraceae bacterium]|nr:dihydrodipicolinate synthase family protein [Oscillospiraceae bacterium]
MTDIKKYEGIIPAFYACYDNEGKVNPAAVRELTRWFIEKGVTGLYVGGSSGECIYQSKEERKLVLENVMAEAKDKLTIIAHIACNNTADSQELAAHAESLGVDAIASIPPIYFKLPPHAIAKYWNDMSAAAPNTDFIIYNIPQLAGVSLTVDLLREMLKNPRVIGVKNSSMPTQDIQMWRDEGAMVFNGPDEQLISGLVMGAVGGIGGTYGAMPELYIELYNCVKSGNMAKALDIQNDCCRIIYKLCSGHGNMYGMIKEALRIMGCPDCGSVRAPLAELNENDYNIANEAAAMIREAIAKYC